MLAKKLAFLTPVLALALAVPQTSGELGQASAAPRLLVYPPVPGLEPSPYYGLRVREVSPVSNIEYQLHNKEFLIIGSMIISKDEESCNMQL